MVVLRIEHAVPDYDAWKVAFDSDPAGRERSGVRRYRILRMLNDPNRVLIDLELDTAREAEALMTVLGRVWGGVAANIVSNPQANIAEVVESREYHRTG
jgi:hypothetical protein